MIGWTPCARPSRYVCQQLAQPCPRVGRRGPCALQKCDSSERPDSRQRWRESKRGDARVASALITAPVNVSQPRLAWDAGSPARTESTVLRSSTPCQSGALCYGLRTKALQRALCLCVPALPKSLSSRELQAQYEGRRGAHGRCCADLAVAAVHPGAPRRPDHVHGQALGTDPDRGSRRARTRSRKRKRRQIGLHAWAEQRAGHARLRRNP